MAISDTVIFKNVAFRWPAANAEGLPKTVRGIYVLFKRKKVGSKTWMNAVYVGRSDGEVRAGCRGRILKHRREGKDFSHFSVYEVADTLREEAIREIEGLFLQVFQSDERSLGLNTQRDYKPLKQLHRGAPERWEITAPTCSVALGATRRRRR